MNLKSSHWSKCIITLPALFKPWDLLCHHSHKICKQFCYCQKKKTLILHHLIWSLLMKSSQWKLRAQQHSPVALYWLRYYALQDVFWLKSWSLTIRMKVTELLSCGTYHSAVHGGCNVWVCGEIPKCNHLHESFCEALFWGIVYHS